MLSLFAISSVVLSFSGKSVQKGIAGDPKLVFIWCMIIAFVIATVIILFRTLFLRQSKNEQIEKQQALKEKYHHYLSELASGNYENKALELMAGNKETTLALSKEDFTLGFHRATLLNELLALHRDLAGEAAHKLREVYLTLGYKSESLEKLQSSSWKKRVQGIQELNQMDIKDAYTPLFKLINDKNKLVRLEAILTRMKMDANPLFLFDELEEELNNLEQLRIHHVLIQLPLAEVPSFIPYLNHDLSSVQLFAVKMCAVFNQVEAEETLLNLLTTEATQLNKIILESIAEIGSEKAVLFIHKLYPSAANGLKVEMIKSLLSISGEEEAEFFAFQLQPENYAIQLAAAKALVKLGEKGDKILNQSVLTDHQEAVVMHAKEWINQ